MLGLRAYRFNRVLGVFGSRAYKVYSQGAEKKKVCRVFMANRV